MSSDPPKESENSITPSTVRWWSDHRINLQLTPKSVKDVTIDIQPEITQSQPDEPSAEVAGPNYFPPNQKRNCLSQYCYVLVIVIGLVGIFIPWWQPYSGTTLLETYQICEKDAGNASQRLNLDQSCEGISHPYMRVSYQVLGSQMECQINQFPSESDQIGHQISDRVVYDMYHPTSCSIFSRDRSSNIYYRGQAGKDRSFSTYLGGGVEFAYILGRYIIFPLCWLVMFIILVVKIRRYYKCREKVEVTL